MSSSEASTAFFSSPLRVLKLGLGPFQSRLGLLGLSLGLFLPLFGTVQLGLHLGYSVCTSFLQSLRICHSLHGHIHWPVFQLSQLLFQFGSIM